MPLRSSTVRGSSLPNDKMPPTPRPPPALTCAEPGPWQFSHSNMPLPFGVAPMGFSRLIAPDGDIALARAAAEAGIPFILSGASLTPMEDVRQAGATSWFQAYVPGEADRIAALVDRVEAAGFDTLVVTVDTAVHPKHERAARHGFRSPVQPSLGLAWQGLSRPGWLRRVMLRDRLAALKFRFENMDAGQGPRETRWPRTTPPRRPAPAPAPAAWSAPALRSLRPSCSRASSTSRRVGVQRRRGGARAASA